MTSLSPTLLWLIVGAALCVMELVLPTAFTESALGFSAFVVALLSLVVPSFGAQVSIWLILSILILIGLRRLLPDNKKNVLQESTYAQTLTEIPPGKTGRVLFEGNSWQARCEDQQLAIAPNQSVYVVGRQGNTLIVLPENLLHS